MSEQMSPHQRAEEVITAWKRGDGCGEPGLVKMVTTALQSQSNADEARHREQQAALRTLLAAALKAKDMVEAQSAEMRRALERIVNNSRDADCGDHCSNSCMYCQGRNALSSSPGEALAKHDGLADYLREAREFSERTFGPGRRTLGVTKHIEKEIAEVRAKPDDLTEWVDLIILAADGYWRHGGQPENLLADMLAKLAKNKARKWPAPTSEDEPVEHDRTHDDPINPELGPEHREYWVRKADGKALERVRREAQIEALEKLPCEYANEQGGETCLDSIESDEMVFCPRCRALWQRAWNARKEAE